VKARIARWAYSDFAFRTLKDEPLFAASINDLAGGRGTKMVARIGFPNMREEGRFEQNLLLGRTQERRENRVWDVRIAVVCVVTVRVASHFLCAAHSRVTGSKAVQK